MRYCCETKLTNSNNKTQTTQATGSHLKNSPTFALYEKQIASILEAIEEISNKGLSQLSSRYLLFAIPYIKSENNNCRREASRIVGNMAAQYPDMIEEAISPLLDNSSNEGTVIRRAAAYALSRIITTDRYAQSELYDKLTDISNKEEDNAIRNQYLKALKKASKVRK